MTKPASISSIAVRIFNNNDNNNNNNNNNIIIVIMIIIIIIIISIAPIPRGPMDCHYLAILRTGQMCHFKNAFPSDSPQHHFVFNLKIKTGAF